MMQRFSIFATIGILFFVLITLGSKSSNAMKSDLCLALASNDQKAIQKSVDGFLFSLPAAEEKQENFERIRAWLAGHDCVLSAEIVPGELDTEPSIKLFSITLKAAGAKRSIGIMLHPGQWKYNLK
jgi:hypothetical protein